MIEISSLIDNYFKQKAFDRAPRGLYDPIDYCMASGGKRFRSILTLMGYDGYGEDMEKALPLAFATELFHNFTLVHDDIMDDAPLRRGKESVYKRYGTNDAILSGDAMHAHVIGIMSQLEGDNVLKIIQRFSQTAVEVCEGQSYDMQFEVTDEVSIQEYLHMIEMKTAVLIGFALESGALLAGVDEAKARHLYLFGKNAGIAFQLQDDFLDLYGDTFKVGKQKCGDIIQKKKNYFYVKAAELLEGKEKSEFKSLYNSDLSVGKRVESVLKIYDDLYLKNYIGESKSAFMDLAFSHLDASGYNEAKKSALKEMAALLADRAK